MQTSGYRTWIEIDTSAITANYAALRSRLLPGTKFLSVIKANAYGHGLIAFAQTLASLGADYFGVYEYDEAKTLRDSGIATPVLILGYTPVETFAYCADKGIEITVSNWDMLRAVADFKNDIAIHIKVDTGLGRQGFLIHDIPEVVLFVQQHPNITVVGLYTHLAAADNPNEFVYTQQQIELLLEWKNSLSDAGYTFLTHAGASSVTLFKEYQPFQFDMVRAGISQYGLYPSSYSANLPASQLLTLTPVLSWKTRISELKHLSVGETIGYDRTKLLERDSVIAVLPIGYWDGYARSLSNCGTVLVNGSVARIAGTICMNMCMVDVTDIPLIAVNDEVVLIGKQGMAEITADDLAHAAGTISYELVTRIHTHIPRLYL